MRRFRFKFNEKTVGLIMIVLGLAGLWRGWLVIAEPVAVHQAPPVVSSTLQGQSVGSKTSVERVACRVITVYDGDTLGCDLNGDGRIQKPQEQVRLLGVDSPEMRYSRKNPTYRSEHPQDEPFAKAASEWLTEKTHGKTVYLEYDARRSDKYSRTLAYVFADAKNTDAKASLNAQLLAHGYATVLFIGKNRRYETEFLSVETQARSAQKGLWASHH